MACRMFSGERKAMLTVKRVATIFFVVVCAVCACATLKAQTTWAKGDDQKPFLHPLFGDDMVLQRGARFPVWGWTTPGARVSVRVLGREAWATADASGRWEARLG